MSKSKRNLPIAAFLSLSALALAPEAEAHIGFSPDNVFTLGDQAREYKEGSTVFFELTVPHACKDESTGEYISTRSVKLLFPNEANLPDTYTQDRQGQRHGANAIMSIRSRATAVWDSNPVTREAVEPFYSHGLRENDVRTIEWAGASIDNDHYERLEFRGKLPKINPESCLAKIKVVVPSVQICEDNAATAWIGTAGSLWDERSEDPKIRVETGYSAAFTIIRTSPLPIECDGEGDTIRIAPSLDEINAHLPPPQEAMCKRRRHKKGKRR